MPKSYQTNLSSANKLIYDRKDGLFVKMQVETPATKYEKGQIVTLTSSGTVEIAANGTQVPFGYVSVANIPADPSGAIHHDEYVTVGTFCADGGFAVVSGGAIAPGALVSANGQDGTDADYMSVVATPAANYAYGIAIEAGAVDDLIKVLYFNSPVLTPA